MIFNNMVKLLPKITDSEKALRKQQSLKKRFPLAANCLPFRDNTQIKSSEIRLQHQ